MKNYFYFFLFALLLIVSACRKDEKFLESSSAMLEFSTDSIAFDTVFTTVGSTTKNFRIYNNHKESILISSIRLKSGEQSAFRINVDGFSGQKVENIEILPEDSLYVFVEVTIDPMDQDNPFFVEEEIEFITNGNMQHVKLLAYGQDAYYIIQDSKIEGLPPFKIAVGENVDTSWTNKRPIVIYGYAVIDSSATLNIEAGTQIYFHNNAGLWVYKGGSIKVNGVKDNPVVFQGDRLEAAYADVPGQWDRIWINDGSLDNSFNYAIIKNAFIGLQVEVFPFENPVNPIVAHLELKNSIIQNCSGFGLYTSLYNINAENLLIANCGQYNLAILAGGNYTFNHCTFVNYFNQAQRESPLMYFQNSNINALGTQIISIPKVDVNNSIIYGANDNEFDFEIIENGSIDFTFRNSVLKTDKDVSDQSTFVNIVLNPSEPIFQNKDIGDFHLANSSSALNIGDLNIANQIPLDLDGNSRVADGMPDAGVFEFKP